jgi:hypothetical protein
MSPSRVATLPIRPLFHKKGIAVSLTITIQHVLLNIIFLIHFSVILNNYTFCFFARLADDDDLEG